MSDDSVDVKFGADTGELESGVDEAKSKLGELGGSAESAGESMKDGFSGIGELLVAAFSVDQIIEFTKGLEEAAEQITRLHTITGLSTDTIQEMQNQMRMTGGDSDTAAQAMIRFERSVYDAAAGSGPAYEAFQKIGVSWDALKHDNIEDLFEKTKEGLRDLTDTTEQNAIGTALFSRGYQNMASAMQLTQAQTQQLDAAFAASGAEMSGDMITKLKEASESTKSLGNDLTGLGVAIVSQVIDNMTSMTAETGNAVSEFRQWVIENDAAEKTMLTLEVALMGLKNAFSGIILTLENVGEIGNSVFASLASRSMEPLKTAIADVDARTQQWKNDTLAAATAMGAALEAAAQKQQGSTGASDLPHSMQSMMDKFKADQAAANQNLNRNPEGQQKTADAAQSNDQELSNDDEAYSQKRELYESDFEAAKSADELKVAQGKMTNSQETADLINALATQKAAVDKSFADQEALYADAHTKYQAALEANDESAMQEYAKDAAAYNKLVDEKAIADNKFADEHNKLMQQQADQDDKIWNSIADKVSQSMDQMVNGVMQGTQTMWEMFGKMLGNLILAMADAVVKMTVQWSAGQLKNLLVTQTTTTQQTAVVTAGQTQQTAAVTAGQTAQTQAKSAAATTGATMQSAADQGSVMKNAGTAASGAYASVAQIPYVGWLLAPAAAAGAFAATAAFGNFDVGTDYVPQDMMAMVHQGERITPASMNVDNKGAAPYTPSTDAGQDSGDTHVHFHVNAMDSGDVQNFFSKHGPTIAKTVSSQMRAGNLKPVGAH